MKFPSSKNILLALLGISIVLISFRLFAIMSFPDAHTLDRDEVQKILPGQTFSQKFIADRDNLETIQFLLRTPGLKGGDTVTVKVADETCSDTLREGLLERPFLNTDNVYIFTFPRLSDSKGKKYCILLSFQDTKNKSKFLQFFTISQENIDLLLMDSANDQLVNGQSLSLRTVYRNDHWWQDLGELNDRISQYKPWFLKDFFIGTIGILFITLSITLIAVLISMRTEKKD